MSIWQRAAATGALRVERARSDSTCRMISVDLGAAGFDCARLRFQLVALRFDFRTLGLVFGTLGFQALRSASVSARVPSTSVAALRFELHVIGVSFCTASTSELCRSSPERADLTSCSCSTPSAVGLKFDFRGFEGLAVGVDLLTIRVNLVRPPSQRARLRAWSARPPVSFALESILVRSPSILSALPKPVRASSSTSRWRAASRQARRLPAAASSWPARLLLEGGSIRVQRRPIAIECFAESREGALHVGESCLLGRLAGAWFRRPPVGPPGRPAT